MPGTLPLPSQLVDVPKLITAYYAEHPDPHDIAQRVAFGTSGHRGSSFDRAFNEDHILAITQAICLYRKHQDIDGPLFIGKDTHALSDPAYVSALEVLAANDVHVMTPDGTPYTPTPAVSHAILTYNRGRSHGFADGIVITPSHNPPRDGGFKYNATNGGPAAGDVTAWIEKKSNEILEGGLKDVRRMTYAAAANAPTTFGHDYVSEYVDHLEHVLDLDAIRSAGAKLGVDPLGGAGVAYWPRIAEQYKLNLTVVSEVVDPTFSFMSLDWDDKIRMDPSSPYAMQRLIGLKDKFDIAFACDTDHDRHGVVTKGAGLLPPNHYLTACVAYLFANREQWSGGGVAVGKTVVSSTMIDRVTAKLGRKLYEVPVGFKWFVDGLVRGSLGFGGEESAGASFLRKDGTPWSTDKDGIIAALLSAEITAKMGRDPGEVYAELTRELGDPVYDRVEAPASREQKAVLTRLSPEDLPASELAGEKITSILTKAPGNGASLGGIKVSTENGWFAARPSGTEEIYKIYGESFRGKEHLARIQEEAKAIVGKAFDNALGKSSK